MKSIIYLIIAILLVACSSTKRVVDVSASKIDSISIATTTAVQVERQMDTTKTERERVVITEIEFSESDTSDVIASLSIRDGILNIGAVRGTPIKFIKQIAIEYEDERKGESEEKHDGKEQKQSASLQKENVKQTRQVAQAPDPYKWRYIFYLSLVLLAGILYFKRMPIINWIKKMLCGLVKH